MYSPNRPEPDLPPWLRASLSWVWKRRRAIGQAAALAVVLATNVGMLVYQLSPTDLERAEADIKKARVVIDALEAESAKCLEEARGHDKRATEHQKLVEESKNSTDTEWLEWQRSKSYAHSQLRDAKYARRDNVLRLATGYRRLLAEAECELLRAKDALNRGTPYKVAPRVREILAPVLATP